MYILPILRKHKIPFFNSKFFFSGLSYTILTQKYLIRIPNTKRVNDFIVEVEDYNNIWSIEKDHLKRFQEEVEIFKKLNKRDAFIKDGLLFIERIENVVSLDTLLHDDRFMFYLKKSIYRLIEYNRSYGFIFGDFHLGNVLVDTKYQKIYLIDFEYSFDESFKVYFLYGNLIVMLNNMLNLHYRYYELYKDDILKLFRELRLDKKEFLKVLNIMKKYLKEKNFAYLREFTDEL
ncbi:hypothetical protein MNB_SM-7-642 [hydrothermal vent metagenome]|uniref:Uncharacterized protein n=1 Tax=hydrothermal vent metagenome TaxID=652676 RepID=A0A1W1BN94_9ZZZZ